MQCLNKLVMFQYSLRRCQETAVMPACEEIHKIFKFTNDTLYAKIPHSHGKYLNLPILLCTQLAQSIYYENIRYILVLNPGQPKFRYPIYSITNSVFSFCFLGTTSPRVNAGDLKPNQYTSKCLKNKRGLVNRLRTNTCLSTSQESFQSPH